MVKNLGLVKAIFVGTVTPTNTSVLWLDTNLPTPLHKAYNPSTGQWEALVYMTLIDNDTIKLNGSNELYVDPTALAAYVLADGSVTLAKMADVASGTVFYRKTAGVGVPEVQTLATLKADLGLTGTNSGDQDLSGYVLKLTTINGKALTGNITLTPTDIGSPAGSGTSTGTNTGDETQVSILLKLGLTDISGENTGDQDASGVPITDVADNFTATNVEDALAELYSLVIANKNVYEISLPSSSTVAGRIAAAVEGTDYPNGWILEVGTNAKDILITHGLSRRVVNVTIFAVDGTEEQQLFNTAAYNGIKTPDIDSLLIQSLATIQKQIKIYMVYV